MRRSFVVAPALASLIAAAPQSKSISPPPPPPPRVFSNSPPPHSPTWNQVENEFDRTTGRITDEPTHELNDMQRLDAEDRGQIPYSPFRDFQLDRDRQLRLDQRASQKPPTTPQQLDEREYELFLNAGLSTTSLQVQADEQALDDAKSQRDAQLIAAENDRETALKQRPADRVQIEADYASRVQQIRQQYEKERERILGYAPATQPATQPTMMK
jgi:hypothetical protein